MAIHGFSLLLMYCCGLGVGLLIFRGENAESEKIEIEKIKCRTVVEIGVCSASGYCRAEYDDGSHGVVGYPKIGDKTGDCG